MSCTRRCCGRTRDVLCRQHTRSWTAPRCAWLFLATLKPWASATLAIPCQPSSCQRPFVPASNLAPMASARPSWRPPLDRCWPHRSPWNRPCSPSSTWPHRSRLPCASSSGRTRPPAPRGRRRRRSPCFPRRAGTCRCLTVCRSDASMKPCQRGTRRRRRRSPQSPRRKPGWRWMHRSGLRCRTPRSPHRGSPSGRSGEALPAATAHVVVRVPAAELRVSLLLGNTQHLVLV
mmetsp:Transcript_25365/g.69234  ORF Transcript_25365/g.69234 Transcript_25365/m.69234 type:complete len:232 (-) Transcript_25365:78-773(-)